MSDLLICSYVRTSRNIFVCGVMALTHQPATLVRLCTKHAAMSMWLSFTNKLEP